MPKVVINTSDRWFDLSIVALERYVELAKLGKIHYYKVNTIKRNFTYTKIPKPKTLAPGTFLSLKDCGDTCTKLSFERNCILYINLIQRDCPHLVQVVEELGAAANTQNSQLKIVEVPDDVQWNIVDQDNGYGEVVEEVHRYWN